MDYLPNGDLIMSDPGNNGLLRITPQGSQTPFGPNEYAYGVRVGPDGNVWTAGWAGVFRVNGTTGEADLIATTGPDGAHSFDWDPTFRRLYIGTVSSDGIGHVYAQELDENMDPIGTAQRFGMPLGDGWHDGVAVDACGYAYIPDYWTNALYRLSPNGTVIKFLDWQPEQFQYGHGAVFGTGEDGWRQDAIYLPMPYNNNTVKEVVVGVPGRNFAGTVINAPDCGALCPGVTFTCTDGEEIPGFSTCNGVADCGDASDEYPLNIDCLEPQCGDGIVQITLDEQCDDGPDNGLYGCDVDCTFRVFTCDDGSAVEWWAPCDGYFNCFDQSDEYPLNPECPEPICGDGIVNWAAGEECDEGAFNGQFSCDVDCTIRTFTCANGFEVEWYAGCNGYFDCFDQSDEYPLNPECPEPVCGDGIVQQSGGEECDDGAQNGQFDCDVDCRYRRFICENGQEIIFWGECDTYPECSDGSDEGPVNPNCPATYTCDDGTPLYTGYPCDGVPHCADGSDEGPLNDQCFPNFVCADGTPIFTGWECDYVVNCADGSDEYPVAPFCQPPFVCADGSFAPPWSQCDIYPNCADGSDEYPLNPFCDEPFTCSDGTQLPWWAPCNGYPDCFDGGDEYPSNPACPAPVVCDGEELPPFLVCDGVINCSNGADEGPTNADCPVTFTCVDGEELYTPNAECSAYAECGDGSDEGPINPSCEPVFSCDDGGFLFEYQYVCNGDPNCLDASDEAPLNPVCPDLSNCPNGDLGSAVGNNVASGSTIGVSDDLDPPCIGEGTAGDIAYAWVAPATGTFVFTTEGSNYDTALYVLDGDCFGPVLACNDDYQGLQSQVILQATQGQAFTIFIDGYSSNEGSYFLSIFGP